MSERAAALGLVAEEFAGFCMLWPAAGGRFVARGQTWGDAFERLAAKNAPAVEEPVPVEIPAELVKACPRCRAAAGEHCKNYLGQNKAICPARLRDEEPVVMGQERGLFDA